METRIIRFLKERKEQGLLRELACVLPMGKTKIRVEGKEYINFSSNDYLGLSSHTELFKKAEEALRPSLGPCASRLMTGSTALHHILEEKTSAFKRKPAALVFNSGYQANVGVISALYGKGDVIFTDKLSHASIMDGIRLSKTKCFRFRHNDTAHLEQLLCRERKNFKEALIVTESIFSMDGDIAPLGKIVKLKQEHDCALMLDEAHATGVLGPNGSGLAEEKGLTDKVDILMGTFSKALGGFGAYLATSKPVRDYLVNTCRSFIYSTSLPPAIMASNIAALDIVRKEPFRREVLLANAAYFRNQLKIKGLCVKGDSQIVPVLTGGNSETIIKSDALKRRGYWVTPVRPPTVPQGKARLRISLTFDHTKDILDEFIYTIENLEMDSR